ncbi:MAG: LysM peptidoglycan-binding domain-containing protein [Candidatus Brocadiia bacterium]
MKPSALVAILVGILIIGVVFIIWISGGFEPKPLIVEAPPEPITSTLTAAEAMTATGFGNLPLTSTMVSEPMSNSYTIKPGDTLWSIAKQFYNGDGTKSKLIAEANKDKIPNPNRLKVGTEIVIPGAESSGMAPRSTGMNEPSGMSEPTYSAGEGQSYTVKKGDTLSKISQKFYGTANKRNIIVDANRDKLATESTTLKVGWKLVIPKLSKSSGKTPSQPQPPRESTPKPADNVPSGASEDSGSGR